ncbi:MAG: hypothetical protein AAB071_00050 [Bacteroidota bacterium]
MKFALVILGILLFPSALFACPSCYGSSSGPMIDGMNAAIATMLGITGSMLCCVTIFFVMMRKRIKYHRGNTLSQSI